MRWQEAAGIRKRVVAATRVRVRVSKVKDVGSTGRDMGRVSYPYKHKDWVNKKKLIRPN
jgi:hypothetical protein